MGDFRTMNNRTMRAALKDVQAILFRDEAGRLYADKEWNADTLEELGRWATEYGLRPPRTNLELDLEAKP